MGLRRAGSRSNATLLTSGGLAIALLVILIGGHVILGYLILSSFFGNGNMGTITTHTSIPTWVLWLMVLGAIAMDGWILYSVRKARKQATER